MSDGGPAVDRFVLETRDVEAGTGFLREMYAAHAPRFSANVEGYRLRYAANTLDGFGIDVMEQPLRVQAEPEPYELLVALAVGAGQVTVSTKVATERAGPGDVLLVDPLRRLSVDQEDVSLVSVRLDLAAARTVAEQVTGLSAADVRFDMARPISATHARRWQATVDYIARSVLAHDDVAAQPIVRAEAFRQLATALITTFPNTALDAYVERPAPRAPAEPAVVRRAVEFMDANAQRDIDVAQIAEASRIGPRGLQAAFRRHRDQTPLEYLRQVRMAGAHRDLQAADPTRGDTVVAIAARWGFTHPGRFSVEYRRRYGRSPGETLRS